MWTARGPEMIQMLFLGASRCFYRHWNSYTLSDSWIKVRVWGVSNNTLQTQSLQHSRKNTHWYWPWYTELLHTVQPPETFLLHTWTMSHDEFLINTEFQTHWLNTPSQSIPGGKFRNLRCSSSIQETKHHAENPKRWRTPTGTQVFSLDWWRNIYSFVHNNP